MGRISEAAMSQRITQQQVAEFVMNSGNGDWQPGEKKEARRNHEKENEDKGKGATLSKARESTPRLMQRSKRRGRWRKQEDGESDTGNDRVQPDSEQRESTSLAANACSK
jgi:hypothetical protein